MSEKFKDWEAKTRVIYRCDCDEREIDCHCQYEVDGCVVRALNEADAREKVRRLYANSDLFFLSTILTIEERP